MQFLKSLYLKPLLFYCLSALVVVFCIGFIFSIFFSIGIFAFIAILILLIIDILLLYKQANGIVASRLISDRLSNGDANQIQLIIENNYPFDVHLSIIDEVPIQFQERNLEFNLSLTKGKKKLINYTITPTQRGEYNFGKLNVYTTANIGFVERKFVFSEEKDVAVYPSFLQMKKYELIAFSNHLTQTGIKKIRKIGRNTEFEKINEYTAGDDFKTINWQATARKGKLMINQYQEEKSQNVYCIIDMGRSMKMPFNGLTLLDYAINSSLVLSNIIAKKYDKPGVITFNNKIKNVLKTDNSGLQMQRIMELLYKQKTGFAESNYEMLYSTIKYKVPQRSLMLLFTNFETLDSLDRQLIYLKGIAKNHLLICIFFENTELTAITKKDVYNTTDVYRQTIAEKFIFEKKLIMKKLNQHGIQTIYTAPENLTINSINKYLEIKSRHLI